MKKKVIASLIALTILAVLVFTACVRDIDKNALNAFGKTANSLYLYADLAIQDVLVADFDPEKYDIEEYRALLEEEIAAYNKTADFVPGSEELRQETEPEYTSPVTLIKAEVEKKYLYQQILYANADDYNAYAKESIAEMDGTAVRTGRLNTVPSEILKNTFVDTKGAEIDVNAICLSKSASDYRFIIADFNCVLYGDGEIVAMVKGMRYSRENACVGTGDAPIAIVIYK